MATALPLSTVLSSYPLNFTITGQALRASDTVVITNLTTCPNNVPEAPLGTTVTVLTGAQTTNFNGDTLNVVTELTNITLNVLNQSMLVCITLSDQVTPVRLATISFQVPRVQLFTPSSVTVPWDQSSTTATLSITGTGFTARDQIFIVTPQQGCPSAGGSSAQGLSLEAPTVTSNLFNLSLSLTVHSDVVLGEYSVCYLSAMSLTNAVSTRIAVLTSTLR